MADCGGDSDVNLNALQRVDPYIVQIVDSATQVALYKFNAKENEWIKTGVEGTLFVYNRSAPPLHGFVIMNRLSKTNQIEPITKDLELQREDPYLLYKNSKLNIFGIWFYGKNDCSKINDSITRLLSKEKDKQTTCQRLRRASESDFMRDEGAQQQQKSIDILSLLSNAEHVYSKNKTIKEESEPKQMIELPSSGTMTSADLIRPTAVRVGGAPDVTRTSPLNLQRSESQEEVVNDPLKALFASATKAQPMPVSILDSCLPPTSSNNGNNNPIPLVQSNPVLQRLMSNPEHLVEHIERQQRNEVSSLATISTPISLQSLEKDLKEKLKLGLAGKASTSTAPDRVVSPDGTPMKIIPSCESKGILTPAMLESIMPNLSTLTSPKQSSGVPQTTHASSFSEAVVTPQMFTTPVKFPTPDIALMHPGMLLSRQPPSKSHTSLNGALADSGDQSKMDRLRIEVPILTKIQMTEAFIYLLQNDAEFGEKLYEGYLKQCTDKRA